jgi:hypothetical protein
MTRGDALEAVAGVLVLVLWLCAGWLWLAIAGAVTP